MSTLKRDPPERPNCRIDDLFKRQKVASQECAEGNRSESSDLTTETAHVSGSSLTQVLQNLCVLVLLPVPVNLWKMLLNVRFQSRLILYYN